MASAINDNIRLFPGDITKAEVDAIVNAANSHMLGGGGVDGAIHRAAGPKLLEECRKVPERNGVRCPVGEARMTLAGNLAAKCVIHTVGPRYGVDKPSSSLLHAAYKSSFNLALDNACTSIAFPAISCGVYGYPIREAGEIAFAVSKGFVDQFERIEFYLMPREVFDTWSKVFNL